MIKSELVEKLADENPHLFQRDIENIVNAILDEVGNAMARGDRVELRGFGAFAVKNRPARVGRNPRTGEQVDVGEKYVPQFKAGKEIRERLNRLSRRRSGTELTMIRRIVGWVVLVPLCLVLIVFALANRQLVVVNFNPLVPSEALTTPGVGVPLFLVLFAVLLFGVRARAASPPGSRRASTGATSAAYRREAERLNREVEAMRRSPSLPTVDDLAKP